MVTEPQRVVDVFRDAADVIRKDGWRTEATREADNRFAALDNRRTLVEAIEWVVPWDGDTPRLVMAFLRRRVGAHDLAAWNDTPGRTVADVLAVLDADSHDLADILSRRSRITTRRLRILAARFSQSAARGLEVGVDQVRLSADGDSPGGAE